VQLHVSMVLIGLLRLIHDDKSFPAKRYSPRMTGISVASISIFLFVCDSMSMLRSLLRFQQITLPFEIALERSKDCFNKLVPGWRIVQIHVETAVVEHGASSD
jgi:hypothetical protein